MEEQQKLSVARFGLTLPCEHQARQRGGILQQCGPHGLVEGNNPGSSWLPWRLSLNVTEETRDTHRSRLGDPEGRVLTSSPDRDEPCPDTGCAGPGIQRAVGQRHVSMNQDEWPVTLLFVWYLDKQARLSADQCGRECMAECQHVVERRESHISTSRHK